MPVERLVGLYVTDDESYQAYRDAMTPILTARGGGFGYDFKVAEMLKSRTDAPINRVFTIYFPDEETLKGFFSDPEYLAIRQRHFAPAVTHVTEMAKYER